MTIQQFIEKAIEGGWRKEDDLRIEEGLWLYDMSGRPDTLIPISSVFLDPEAWKAVGRVEGWGEYDPDLIRDYHSGNNWWDNMHRMIDALAEGKKTEQYLETL